MCGILGTFKAPGKAIDLRRARRAMDLIRHRGPDDEGYFLARGQGQSLNGISCGGGDTDQRLDLPDLLDFEDQAFDLLLGHRRLSILDLSAAGHQPMGDPSGRYWIVFNGEIYNYLELRAELSGQGFEFRTGTDTEVILAAYRQWGTGMLPRFIGMFALALYDVDAGELLLARDHFGIKPLYYTASEDQFSFASEMKPLLELSEIRRQVHANQLYQYLRFGITDSGGETLFAAMHQLPAASYLKVCLKDLSVQGPTPYWSIDLGHKIELSFGEAVATARDLLRESVDLHMRSDVPVGSCLSGGLDSSAIVMMMREMLKGGQDLHTFSYIADHPKLSEKPYVDIAVAASRATGHETTFTPDLLLEDLPTLIRQQDVPFGSTSIYAQYRVFQLAREAGIKVMLDGQGSDEIFGGYDTAISAQGTSLLAQGRLRAALQLFRSSRYVDLGSGRRMVLASLGRLLPTPLMVPLMGWVGEELFPQWMDAGWFETHGVQARPRVQGRGRESLREELLLSVRTLSLPALLRYEDRNSMAFSIESRVPFCNHRLAEFAFSLPSTHLVSPDGRTKAVFREAMRGFVPGEIIDRPKVGFGTPETGWLEKLASEFLNEFADNTRLSPLKQEAVIELLRGGTHKKSYSLGPVWRIINFAWWARTFDVTFE